MTVYLELLVRLVTPSVRSFDSEHDVANLMVNQRGVIRLSSVMSPLQRFRPTSYTKVPRRTRGKSDWREGVTNSTYTYIPKDRTFQS